MAVSSPLSLTQGLYPVIYITQLTDHHQLTRAQIAGIVVAFVILTSILVAGIITIIIYRKRTRSSDEPADNAGAQNEEPDLALPGPTNSDARRTNPQTFYDWVRAGNPPSPPSSSTAKPQPQQQQGHDRFPSLEHGPGPIIRSRSTMPTTATSLKRSATGDSAKASSLRRAVLDVGAKGEDETRKKKAEKVVGARQYTGCMALRQHSSGWRSLRSFLRTFEIRIMQAGGFRGGKLHICN